MTRAVNLDRGWRFRRILGVEMAEAWSEIALPHCPFVSDLDGAHHWFGLCEYERVLDGFALAADEQCALYVGAAMHTARISINGREIAHHEGGYLPFEIDLTDAIRGSSRPVLSVQLDNRDNPDIPPGKPFDELDFCWYGGLYRQVELRVRSAVHITDANTADAPGGGGVFIRTLSLGPNSATIGVKTHVRNALSSVQEIRVRTVLEHQGTIVASGLSDGVNVAAGSSVEIEQVLTISSPARWSPAQPNLHQAHITAIAQGVEIDKRRETFGVRRIAFSRSGGFVVNGQRLRLRGTNRHQEMPRVGYAVPRAAQQRDARRIKEAGFDYVRLAHYPQSPDFLEACDSLGIVVMACIPGWQFAGGEKFQNACCDAARQLIRRDRNHPSVVLWELSLNETQMSESLMQRLHPIGHEEYPGDQMFTCGWIDRYDVFLHSRQHGQIHSWKNGDKALVIAEYGNWEFYARNDGFDQKTGAGVFDRWSTSRQFRGNGERGLRQQAFNHSLALNDTLSSPAVLDGVWAMFDYARGYDPLRAADGVMDIFRLPKFSYYFYRSQRNPDETGPGWSGGPMVFIASHWLPSSDLRIVVYSNCEEVELRLNGNVIDRNGCSNTALTQHLPHPPFIFDLKQFTPGTLEAVGYVANRPKASHRVGTPGSPAQLEIVIDELAIQPTATEPDVLFAHARWCDAAGNLCVEETAPVNFSVVGAAAIVGPAILPAEAGIVSVVLRVPANSSGFILCAAACGNMLVPPVEIPWPGPRSAAAVSPSATAA